MNFSRNLEEAIKEHRRLTGFRDGWKVLLNKDKDFDNILNNHISDNTQIIIRASLHFNRLKFISILQLNYPDLTKVNLFKILEIKEEDYKKFT